MSQLSTNLFLNFINRAWGVLLSFILIPKYIHFLGIESYGIIGLYTTLTSLLIVFDLGFGTTINREMAKFSLEHHAKQIPSFTRTLEWIYWFTAFAIGLLITLLSPWIAKYWLSAKNISIDSLQSAVILIAIAISFNWPSVLYTNALIGLQKQVSLNVISIIMTTVRSFGVFLVLYFSPTIQTFFFWQIFINFFQTFLYAKILWKVLPSPKIFQFEKKFLKENWNFAKGVTGISLTAITLTYLDKIILSKFLDLENYGYYMLACSIANALTYITGPMVTAFFPRFSQLALVKESEVHKSFYHHSCKLMSVLILPISFFIILFSQELVFIWTKNELISQKTHLLACFMTIGFMFNGLATIPYILQLSYGWTRLIFIQNLISILLLVPMIFLSVKHVGPIGAAFSWMLINLCYVTFTVPLMHRKLLKNETFHWYIQDILIPLIGSSIPLLCLKMFSFKHLNSFMQIFLFTISLCLSILSAMLITTSIRKIIIDRLQKLKRMIPLWKSQ